MLPGDLYSAPDNYGEAFMRYWLFKSEPDVFGIDHLAQRPDHTEPWDGVRNYQARNFLRDEVHFILYLQSYCLHYS